MPQKKPGRVDGSLSIGKENAAECVFICRVFWEKELAWQQGFYTVFGAEQ